MQPPKCTQCPRWTNCTYRMPVHLDEVTMWCTWHRAAVKIITPWYYHVQSLLPPTCAVQAAQQLMPAVLWRLLCTAAQRLGERREKVFQLCRLPGAAHCARQLAAMPELPVNALAGAMSGYVSSERWAPLVELALCRHARQIPEAKILGAMLAVMMSLSRALCS